MVAPVKPYRLPTFKEEAFAQAIAKGMPLAEAFDAAYPGRADKRQHRKQEAHKVAQRPHVRARILELQKPDVARLYLTRARKRELLYEIAHDKRGSRTDRMRAVHLDNLMVSEYKTVVHLEGEVTLGVIMANLGDTTGLPRPDELASLGAAPLPAAPAGGAEVVDVEASAPVVESRIPGPMEQD